jgi:hypothetical protein
MRAKILLSLIFALLGGCWIANGQTFIGRPLFPLNSAVDPAAQSLTNDLAAYWRFDEVSGNRSSNWPDTPVVLTDTGSLPSTTGILTNALDYTAQGKYLIGGTPTTSSDEKTFSFSVWIYPTDTGTEHYILDARRPSQQGVFGLNRGTDTKLFWFVANGLGSYSGVTHPTNVTANAWHHVYAENNVTNNTVSISLDGSALTSAAEAISKPYGSEFRVGAYWNAPSSSLNWVGRIDELAVWNRTLTTNEIQFIYNSGSPRTCCNPNWYLP